MTAALFWLRRLPGWLWAVLGLALALVLAARWHEAALTEARKAARLEQAAIDRAVFSEAQDAAEELQRIEIARVKERAARINKETENALQDDRDTIARRYDDLRVRWQQARANPGSAGARGSTGPAGATAFVDDAACAALGWVSFDVAATAAQAADEAIAKDDAWQNWWSAQAAAWPGAAVP